MKKLIIHELQSDGKRDIIFLEELLEKGADFQYVKTINWQEYPYKPVVRFKMAYYDDQILLKYYVSEESIKASVSEVNGDVYKDSCVEFFISPDSDGAYYNFEFNCIGVPSASFGSGRHDRELIDPEILKGIQTRSSLGSLPFEEKTGGHQWELMIVIPAACMVKNKNLQLKELDSRVNLYKCGDETIQPHFVSWNPIGTSTPDFHQTEYFGELLFR